MSRCWGGWGIGSAGASPNGSVRFRSAEVARPGKPARPAPQRTRRLLVAVLALAGCSAPATSNGPAKVPIPFGEYLGQLGGGVYWVRVYAFCDGPTKVYVAIGSEKRSGIATAVGGCAR